ncbi:MAG: dihydrolipoyl dehydrogenase [Cycloclasticus sp.]|nr:dihydrolipoyl dehydrogenase [Cycloclasticus sp.]
MSSENTFDVIIVGGGPGGYIAAIRCAQLGLKAACVDDFTGKDNKASLGGTCLNVGCIPSKALLESSHHYEQLNHGLENHGIKVSGVKIDIPAMIKNKDDIVGRLTGGISGLFKANKVTSFHGRGKLLAGKKIEITTNNNDVSIISGESIILATGSRPIDIASAPIDNKNIVDSTGALDFDKTPKKLGIIGAGVIGLELGSVWSRLGADVVLLEAQDTFLPAADTKIAAEAKRQFKKQGLDIKMSTRVTKATSKGKKVTVNYEDSSGEHTIELDKLIVSVGRRPNTDNLFAPEAPIELDERGFVEVDEIWQTNIAGVYAIGDLIRGPMLAHKASEEGVAVAEVIYGEEPEINYAVIPSVIYTSPEIAWVGQTEQHLKSAGEKIKIGTFPFAASGRAQALGDTTGMVKMISSVETDEILGVHIIGPQASELVAEAVLAMEYSASTEDLALTIHAHPTLSEALHEAALAVDNRALHIPNR